MDEDNLFKKMYIERWLSETNDVKCFILYENKVIKTFALLSKCDYCPFNTHFKPHVLEFIYTFIPYRRNGLAYMLLSYMKKTNEITAFVAAINQSSCFKKPNMC